MGFIEMTQPDGRDIYINTDHIVCFGKSENGDIAICTHTGRIEVKQTLDEVIKAINFDGVKDALGAYLQKKDIPNILCKEKVNK